MDKITCLATDNSLDMMVSVCTGGTIAVHHLKDGRSVTMIKRHKGDETLKHLLISEISGNFVIFSQRDATIYLYSLNGVLLGMSLTFTSNSGRKNKRRSRNIVYVPHQGWKVYETSAVPT